MNLASILPPQLSSVLSRNSTEILRRDSLMEALESRLVFSFSPTGIEQEMLELLNRMRMDPANELEEIFLSTNSSDADYFTTADSDVNLALDFFGVDDTTLFSQWASLSEAPPLAWNEALYDASEAHNERMILQQLQSHQLPADPSLGLLAEDSLLDRAENAGYDWAGSVRVGENVFAYTESAFHGHAAFAIDWGNTSTGIQDPAGHRDNMLDPDFQEIGISIVAHTPTSSTDVGPFVVTTDFGERGNYGNPKALGVVFADADGDSFYDAGEGLGGITITLTNGGTSYSTTTMDAGGWQVAVAAGTYDVVASGGSLASALSMGSIVVGSDNVKVDLDTTAAPTTGDIAGTVFSDADADTNIDGSESRLAGWVVFADEDGDGELDAGEVSDVTDASGEYSLLAVSPGSVTVTVVEQMGFRPTSSNAKAVTVEAGASETGLNFGQYEFYTVSGSTGTLVGTQQDDTFTWEAGAATHEVVVNGYSVTIDISEVSTINLNSGMGEDTLTLTGDARDEYFIAYQGTIDVTGADYTVEAKRFEIANLYSGGDSESAAYLYDTSSDDVFTANSVSAQMLGGGLNFTAFNFAEVHGRSTEGGVDYAYLTDGATDDVFTGQTGYATLESTTGGFYLQARGFTRAIGLATEGGNDVANLYDGATDDVFIANKNNSLLRGNNHEFYNKVNGFETVIGYSLNGGTDIAKMYDSEGDDTLTVVENQANLTRADAAFHNVGFGFSKFEIYAENGGEDHATVGDSSGDDTFTGTPTSSTIISSDGAYHAVINGFDRVIANKTEGGTDYAYLYDGATDDRFIGRPGNAVLRDVDYSFYYKVNNFDRAIGFALEGGEDFAYLYDGSSDDRLIAKAKNTVLKAYDDSFYNKVNNFERVFAYSTAGGSDRADLFDADTDDQYSIYPDVVVMRATDDSFYNYATGFAESYAHATGAGNDIVSVNDSTGDDTFVAHPTYGRISGTGFYHYFADFNSVTATASNGGFDTARLNDSSGDDDFVGSGDSAYLSGVSFFNRAIGFDRVEAIGENGGTNSLSASSIDYVLEQIGSWL